MRTKLFASAFVVCVVVLSLIVQVPPADAKHVAADQFVSGTSANFRASDEFRSVTFLQSGGWVVLQGRNGYDAQKVPQLLLDALEELNTDNEEIKQVAVTADNRWIVLFGYAGARWDEMPPKMEAKIRYYNKNDYEIVWVGISPDDDWVVITDTETASSLSDDYSKLVSRLKSNTANDLNPVQIAFQLDGEGYFMLFHEGTVVYGGDGFPSELDDKIDEIYDTKNEAIITLSFAPDGGYFVDYESGLYANGIPDGAAEYIKDLHGMN